MSQLTRARSSLPLFLAFLTLTVAPAYAAVQCVNPGGTDGCFATIQAAINAAGHLESAPASMAGCDEALHPAKAQHMPSTCERCAAPERTVLLSVASTCFRADPALSAKASSTSAPLHFERE